jgi:hypothetical protein
VENGSSTSGQSNGWATILQSHPMRPDRGVAEHSLQVENGSSTSGHSNGRATISL